MKVILGFFLVTVSILWTNLHFLLAIFRAGQWWDVIPLIGMGLVTYGFWWCVVKVWRARDQMGHISNAFFNLSTLSSMAKDSPRGREIMERLMLPPEEFKRQLRAG